MMRSLILILFLLCFTTISYAHQKPVLHDATGKSIPLSDLKGKWIIVNYWAEWCDSCMEEVPELNKFYSNNQDKNVVLYGVEYDHIPTPKLRAAIAKMHINYPVIVEDPAAIWSLSAFDALPMTFIIGPHGRVVKKIMGESTEASLSAVIQTLQKKMST